MALTRDVPFADYDINALTNAAAADLNAMSDFRGPKVAGFVTTGTLYRGLTPGDLVGPYISQFLWRTAPFGVEYVERRMRTRTAGVDYMTNYAEWLDVQNGCNPGAALTNLRGDTSSTAAICLSGFISTCCFRPILMPA